MNSNIMPLTKNDTRLLKVKLHPFKFMHYVDYKGVRVSEFYSCEKQAKFEINKIKTALNKWDTWEIECYEIVD